MNIWYLVYQAERQRSGAEQREADVRAGELAAGIAGAGRSVKAAVARGLGAGRAPAPCVPGDDLIPEGTSSRC